MEIRSLYNQIAEMLTVQGFKSYLERMETLYYDESGNDKHLVVKEGKLNAPYDATFVLGGVQADGTMSLIDLKNYLGVDPAKELKAQKDLKGSFLDIMRKTKVKNVLNLIDEKGWHIHFKAVQALYYSFVDIVDSIDGLEEDPWEFKAVLYDVLKKHPNEIVELFKKYKYPNIKEEDKAVFLDGLIYFLQKSIKEDMSKALMCPHKIYMCSRFNAAKEQRSLTFIQDEKPHEWVANYLQFYRQEIVTFRHKTLVFDEEKQVQADLIKDDLSYNGAILNNYSFCDSTTNALIQLSDYVVGILRKYFMFLDRLQADVDKDIASFDETQIENFRLMNLLLKKSLAYNPLFINTTVSIHCRKKMDKYIDMYGVE